MKKQNAYDLRAALRKLGNDPDDLIGLSAPVDLNAELIGVYRHIGAGGTVMRPTREGPAVMFDNVRDHPDDRVLIGLLASRRRIARLFDTEPERLPHLLLDAIKSPIAPVVVDAKGAPSREVVHLASDPDFDLRKILPVPTVTEEDGGPFICFGMCYASDPETGESDITIHRLCVQGKDEMTMFFTPGARHLGYFREKAERMDRPLPITINIGVDPAIELSACFEPPTTPLGYDELNIAGGIRRQPVELIEALTVPARAIANAEYVIEAEILPHARRREDAVTGSGKAMPEFPGYTGSILFEVPVVKVKAVTHRRGPIFQTCIGPGLEHACLTGIPTEASILQMVEQAMPGRLKAVYAHPSGGGKYLSILQFVKRDPSDEGRQRQAALLAFSAFSELKHVILVDEDVDIYDTDDVLWALNTRYQGDRDTVFLPGFRCHPLDPTENPVYNPLLRAKGLSCKTIFDCTVPFDMKGDFMRSRFMELDISRYMKEEYVNAPVI